MHAIRTLEIINNARVPDLKKPFWPKWSAIFVSREGEVVDVIQYFETPNVENLAKDHALYPGTAYFLAQAGVMYHSVTQIEERIQSCQEALVPPGIEGHSGALLLIDGRWVSSPGSTTDGQRKE